ncbi:hypothetical protein J4573_45030 [Actinomadura barringtoniae]|uniref:Uncharacterized protein n=1 Tax=Actinomadura barringtoniae TaxID=1427535 RepID=A0A939PJZ5_9ACTN|nr:hypothetical protein [Actinomadura barringtoniae]MBO2454317.1 hypothetical protein [Actinomadura barringtoniae]
MGNKSEIDVDEVKKILKVLKDEIAKFDDGSQGTRSEISVKGHMTSGELGNYPAVTQGLGLTTNQAYGQIKGQYDAFVNAYDQVIQSLEQIVKNHGDKEQQNTAAANRVTTNSSNQPTTSNTSSW